MKIKRVTSVCLIFLVLLTSSGYNEGISQIDPCLGDSSSPSSSITKYAQDLSQEFREGFKLSLLEETRSDTDFLVHKPTTFVHVIPDLQYDSYRRAHFSKAPSKRLFIDFGALII